jgi:CBS domain-containing protein
MQFDQLKRRDFITLLGGWAVALPLVARAQQAGQRPTIGFLGTSSSVAWTRWTAAFVRRLGELGWIDGRNVTIEYRWAEGRAERFLGLISEREIVHAFSRYGETAASMPVQEIMRHGVITVSSEESVNRVMNLMTLHRVRHMPVLRDGNLVGIISIGDVVKHRLGDLELETNVLRDAYIAAH